MEERKTENKDVKTKRGIGFWHIAVIALLVLLLSLNIGIFLVYNQLQYIYVPDEIGVYNQEFYKITSQLSDIADSIDNIGNYL